MAFNTSNQEHIDSATFNAIMSVHAAEEGHSAKFNAIMSAHAAEERHSKELLDKLVVLEQNMGFFAHDEAHADAAAPEVTTNNKMRFQFAATKSAKPQEAEAADDATAEATSAPACN